MPKINGKNVDPKAYAARMTQAKKTVASIDPATKAKLKEFYPNVSREDIAKSILDSRADGGVTTKTKTVNKIYRPSK
jgi:hypothetical protein